MPEVGKRHYLAGFLCTLSLFIVLSQIAKNDVPVFTISDPIGIEYAPYGMDFQRESPPAEPEEIVDNEPLPEVTIPEEVFIMEPSPPTKDLSPYVVSPPEIRLRKPRSRIMHARVVPPEPVIRGGKESGSSGSVAKPGVPGGLRTYGVAEVDEPPKVLRSVKPVYPLRARRLMVEGEVVARFVVGRDGSIEDIQIVSANPEGYFEKSVIEALKKWKFSPGKYRGQTVRTLVVLPVKFRLKE